MRHMLLELRSNSVWLSKLVLGSSVLLSFFNIRTAHAYSVDCVAMNKVVPVGISTVCRYHSGVRPPWNVLGYTATYPTDATQFIANGPSTTSRALEQLEADLTRKYATYDFGLNSDSFDNFSRIVAAANDQGKIVQYEEVSNLVSSGTLGGVTASIVRSVELTGAPTQTVVTIGDRLSEPNSVAKNAYYIVTQFAPPYVPPNTLAESRPYMSSDSKYLLQQFRNFKNLAQKDVNRAREILRQALATTSSGSRLTLMNNAKLAYEYAFQEHLDAKFWLDQLFRNMEIVGKVAEMELLMQMEINQWWNIRSELSVIGQELFKLPQWVIIPDPAGRTTTMITVDEANEILVSLGDAAFFAAGVSLDPAKEVIAIGKVAKVLNDLLTAPKKSCYLRDGTSVPHGLTISAFTSPTMPLMLGCATARQAQSCNNGVLTNTSAQYSSCRTVSW